MRKENFLTPNDREMRDLAHSFERGRQSGRPAYMDSEDLADLADWYAINNEHEKAMDACRYGLRLHPRSSSLLIELAYLYLDENKLDMAEETTDAVPEQDLVEVIILRAHLLAERGDKVGMKRMLDGIRDFEFVQNAVEAAYLYNDTGSTGLGIQLLESLREEYGEEEPYLACLGDCYSAAGRYQEAIEAYNKLIDFDPYSPRYWVALATTYYYLGQYDKTIEACDYALVADEENINAHQIRGYAFAALGNDEEAHKCYLAAQKAAGVHTETDGGDKGGTRRSEPLPPDVVMPALEQVMMEEWDEGIYQLTQLIKQIPHGNAMLPTLYANLALCYFRTGHKRKGHNYCRKAKDADPESHEGYLMEGRFYMEEGKMEQAVMEWGEVYKLTSNSPDFSFVIGNWCLEAGQVRYALHAFERVLRENPKYGMHIHEKMTVAAIVLGEKEKFLEHNAQCERPIDLKDLSHPTGLLADAGLGDEAQLLLNAIHRMLEGTL